MNNPTTTNTTSNGTTTSTSPSTTSSSISGAAASVRERINDGIDTATSRIGEAVEGRANSIASKTQELLTSVAHTGQYLQNSEPKALGADLVAVIKRHPVLTLAAGVGFGMLFSKMFRR